MFIAATLVKLISITVLCLPQHGQPVNKPTANTPDEALLSAVEDNDLKGVATALDRGADIEVEAYPVKTPLTYAAENHRVALTRLLLRHGADPNKQNIDGNTPIHCATFSGDGKILLLLLEHKADPNVRDSGGDVPLGYATSYVPKYVYLVKILLDHHADPNIVSGASGTLGESPLMAAAGFGNTIAVKLLLEHGADFKAKDPKGNTALSFARKRLHPKIERLLLKAGETE